MTCIFKRFFSTESQDGTRQENRLRLTPQCHLAIALKNKLHQLSSSVMGVPVDPCYRPPSFSSGELLGVEYLYGENVSTLSLDVDKEIDEGIGDLLNPC
jgi:hypothetical protein